MDPLNLLSRLNPYMIWIKLGAAVLAAVAIVGATHYVDADHYERKIAGIELAHANEKTASVQASLDQLSGFVARITAAGTGYQSDMQHITDHFATIELEFKDALHVPLPADCRPDVARLRVLTNAVAAANEGPRPVK